MFSPETSTSLREMPGDVCASTFVGFTNLHPQQVQSDPSLEGETLEGVLADDVKTLDGALAVDDLGGIVRLKFAQLFAARNFQFTQGDNDKFGSRAFWRPAAAWRHWMRRKPWATPECNRNAWRGKESGEASQRTVPATIPLPA
ncbi:hypothetical protein J2W27_004487 [Variovorax boronicumulans]|uniref:hypothetical protein n=1 Tax=Variovorax boronicumulans TaxID=436515 RepID=UPI002787AC83|nr:hypothetical protein [Variovorax boronicumulans]MDP9912361.1 hypothetical protein [Variovorax boronicumulans]